MAQQTLTGNAKTLGAVADGGTVTITPSEYPQIIGGVVLSTAPITATINATTGDFSIDVTQGAKVKVKCVDGRGKVFCNAHIHITSDASANLSSYLPVQTTPATISAGYVETFNTRSGNVSLTFADLTTLGITSSINELNVLDGVPATLTATELGYVDGVTSSIQTQLGTKVEKTITSGVNTTSMAGTAYSRTLSAAASGYQSNVQVDTSAAAISGQNGIGGESYVASGTEGIVSIYGSDSISLATSGPTSERLTITQAGSTRIGDSTNNTTFETDGTMVMNGTATVWEDLRVEPSVRGTGVRNPSFEQYLTNGAGSIGVFLYSFDDALVAAEKEIYFTVQMPHAWKGTAIYPHVHWIGSAADTAANPRWGLEYSWADIGTDFGNTTIIYTTAEKIGAGGATDANVTINRHYINAFSAITPTTSQDGISSVLIGRLFRNSSDAGDTYNVGGNKCGLLYIDIHYEIDTLGSRTEYTK